MLSLLVHVFFNIYGDIFCNGSFIVIFIYFNLLRNMFYIYTETRLDMVLITDYHHLELKTVCSSGTTSILKEIHKVVGQIFDFLGCMVKQLRYKSFFLFDIICAIWEHSCFLTFAHSFPYYNEITVGNTFRRVTGDNEDRHFTRQGNECRTTKTRHTRQTFDIY